MNKLKVGIIGYGRLGKGRSRDIMTNENYSLTSISDPVEKANYRSYKEMLKKENLDVVFICVPHTLLTGIAVDCIEHGLNVFCEKPPGINLKETKTIYDAHKKNSDKKLAFGFNHRYHNHIKMALEEISNENKYGNIMWMSGTYGKAHLETWRTNKALAGRGILLSQGIHMVDLMRLFLKEQNITKNEEFTNISSIVSNFNKDWYDDNVFALMKSDSVSSSLHSSSVMWKNTFSLDICSTKGLFKIRGLFTSTKSFGFPESLSISTKDGSFYGNPTETIHYFGNDISFREETDQYVKLVRNNEYGRLGTIEDAIEVMKILEKIYNG